MKVEEWVWVRRETTFLLKVVQFEQKFAASGENGVKQCDILMSSPRRQLCIPSTKAGKTVGKPSSVSLSPQVLTQFKNFRRLVGLQHLIICSPFLQALLTRRFLSTLI